MPGAALRLQWAADRPFLGDGAIESPDEAGWWTALRPAGTESTLRIVAAGFLPWERRIPADQDQVEAVLGRAAHVRFRVSGLPPSDVEPDENGLFLVPAPRVGDGFRLWLPGCFGSRTDYFTETLLLQDAETVDLGVLRPAARGVLAGRVVDPGGAPVPGALVDLREPIADEPAWTDKDGGFRFEDRPLAPTRVLVRAEGFPDLWHEADPRVEIVLRLEAGIEVRGRLVDADNVPFPGKRLPFFPVRADGTLDMDRYREADVDSLGRFRLLLPPGRFQPLYHGPRGSGGRGPGPVVDTRAGSQEIEVRLPWPLGLWH